MVGAREIESDPAISDGDRYLEADRLIGVAVVIERVLRRVAALR